jgi:eukaryotic-like serine/threonine-protein kinase
MDSHARAWSEAHRGACMAHRGGASSDPMFDREASCLAQRLGDIKSAVSVLEQTTEKSLSGAPDVAAGVHDATACLDVARLLNDSVPPTKVRAEVALVRDQISTAAALKRAGRVTESEKAITEALFAARRTDYQPVIAEAQLEFGRLLITEEAYVRAIAMLREAMQTALANNLPALAVEAVARKIFAEGQTAPDPDRAARDSEFAEAMSRSIIGDHFARALLFSNVGNVYTASLRPADAFKYYERAREAIKDDRSPDVELTCIDLNIGESNPDAAVRVRTLNDVANRRAMVLGDHHPLTLQARFAAALLGDDPKATYSMLGPICDAYRQLEKHPPYFACEREVALFAEVNGDVPAMQAALAIVAGADPSDPELATWRRLATAELALSRGDRAAAENQLSGLTETKADMQWWDHANAWEAAIYLARIQVANGNVDGARRSATEAFTGFETIEKTNFALEYRVRADQAKSVLRH